MIRAKPQNQVKKLTREQLNDIGVAVIELLHKYSKEELFDYSTTKNYHGFGKTNIKPHILRPFLEKYHIAPDALDVTLVSLTSEYLGSVHVHPNSHAICFVLGEKEGFIDAKDAYAVVDPHWVSVKEEESIGEAADREKWFPIHSGDKVYNPTNVAHGFCARGSTQYFLLCVQSPMIDNPKHDDWIAAKII
jgi:hypothetical protein